MFLSLGLVEFAIMGFALALLLIAGAIIAAIVVARRKKARADGEADSTVAGTPQGSRNVVKWILAALAVAVLAPLLVVLGGVLLVTPVRREQSPASSEIVVIGPVEVGEATGAEVGTPTVLAPQNPRPVDDRQPEGALTVSPQNPAQFVLIPGIAGLLVLLVIGAMAVAGSGGKPTLAPAADTGPGGEDAVLGKLIRFRLGFLAIILWLAFSLYLFLDIRYAVSVYLGFVVAYALFWVLVGALLLVGRPLRDKVVVLSLFVLALVAVHFVNWNSRKPFLMEFRSVEIGMTQDEVDDIMGTYMKSYGGSDPQDQYLLNEQGALVRGTVTYRHTDQAWGDADLGVVVFDDGKVTETRFLPD
jgi:hypothetical protein